ncbi:restriction endonuclease subunit S [Leuconostoc mesenteroides]|uniref:restriction endonuclease subunit S n=1 Tax=Leuconostoc mesenteroides TaxID=1245 RepID=UPI00235E7929|nr:restriction endonuclease subunit S [Leuconostoc mesenteroides]
MQTKKRKSPSLRFRGYTDDWEERKLGDILSERNDQMPETNEYPLMSFVQGKGVTPKGERYNRSFLVKDSEKKYKKTKLGDFIYSSNNLETGSIGFNRTGKAVISPVYSIFESKKARESQFIGIMSARKDFISEMVRFRQGVVYGQWRIHESDFLNINIKIPNDKEQHLIISLFESIDNTIALHQRKLDLLKEQKKGFLQKMFPKNGARVPELRFAGFADDWEQRKSSAIFHTITDFVANGSFASLRENVSYSDKLDYAIVVRLTDYSNGYKGPFLYTSKSGYDFLKKSSLNPNDILISNVGANAGLVFKAPILDVPMTLGPNSILVRTSDQDREFMYQLMRSTTGEHLIKTQIGISAQPKFNKTDFKQIIFTIPKSQEEQQKIGNLFHELDHTIALHQRKLDLLKEQKKGFLQKMFV